MAYDELVIAVELIYNGVDKWYSQVSKNVLVAILQMF